jgi:alpha-glucuronidase
MKRSNIPDKHGRVGNYPGRYEAEDQSLTGYESTPIKPWEAASGSGAAQLPENVATGTIRFQYDGDPGTKELHVQYYDEEDGVSKFKLSIAGQVVDEWQADNHVPTPTTVPDAHSSIRRTVRNLNLKPGDEIRLDGTADGGERAAVDYFEILPAAAGAASN